MRSSKFVLVGLVIAAACNGDELENTETAAPVVNGAIAFTDALQAGWSDWSLVSRATWRTPRRSRRASARCR